MIKHTSSFRKQFLNDVLLALISLVLFLHSKIVDQHRSILRGNVREFSQIWFYLFIKFFHHFFENESIDVIASKVFNNNWFNSRNLSYNQISPVVSFLNLHELLEALMNTTCWIKYAATCKYPAPIQKTSATSPSGWVFNRGAYAAATAIGSSISLTGILSDGITSGWFCLLAGKGVGLTILFTTLFTQSSTKFL